ncbi:MAG TPA: hypothetical protein VF782_02590 [Allosphingosinicella sp.]|jgi:hypothetical protein
MRKFVIAAALGTASLGLAACGDRGEGNAAVNESGDTAGNGLETDGPGAGGTNAAAAGAAASSSFPKGARIVEEKGITYRVDADGTRVRLGDTDSRIVVENGVRYRVDPGGTRVRINDQGLDIDVPDLTPDLGPDVDVGINKNGNPDVDVKDKKDGNDGPN